MFPATSSFQTTSSFPTNKFNGFKSFQPDDSSISFSNKSFSNKSVKIEEPNNISLNTQQNKSFQLTNIEFNIYSDIQSHFLNIKTLSLFNNSLEKILSEFIIINNISIESVEKLGDLSTIYIKKINDQSISSLNITKLNKMFEKHFDLISKIIKFNNIFNELSINIKQIKTIDLSQEQIEFTFSEIFNRYKLQIFEIISDIKIINTYLTLLN